jgi:beta-lactamase regulating signal transducer with metallopeptidase domain
MSILIQYLIKLFISLSVVWLFYQFVLRRLTFYNSNRWYLLGYTLLSFLIPFINITPALDKNQFNGNGIVQLIPAVDQYTVALQNASQFPVSIWSSNYDKWDLLAFTLMAGAVIFLARFFIRCISFFRMRRKAKLISTEGVKIYKVDGHIIPFSFGNAVFINSDLHTEAELQEIIRHEFVHVKQKHTLDILWSEWLCIINWYNPFAWLLKASIRQNLEFIADNKVLENGVSKKQYQYLLLKVIGNNQFSIAPKFNFSSLKKRIAMMNKLKSARMHLVRFLFILPLLAVILISFRKQIGDQLPGKQKNEANAKDQLPDASAPGDEWTPRPTESEKDFLKRHSKIKNISWGYIVSVTNDGTAIPRKAGDPIMTIHFTNGNWDMYNLGQAADVEKFKKNYGEMPPDAPPPPQTSTTAPYFIDSLPRMTEPNEKGYLIDVIGVGGDCTVVVKDKNGKEIDRLLLTKWKERQDYYDDKYGEILAPPPPVPPVPPIPPAPPKLPDNVKSININNNKVLVKLKDGTSEKYDLNVRDQKAAFEKKYGNLLEPPIPPIPLTPITEPLSPVEPLAPIETTPAPVAIGFNGINTDKISRVSNDFEITDKSAVIKLKNGTVERYDLTKADEKATFEKKYGRIISTHITTSVDMAPMAVATGVSNTTIVSPVAVSSSVDVLAINDYTHVVTGHEDILITITSKTTAEQLEDFKKQMKEKGVELKFEKVDFKNGILIHIDGTMKSKDSQSNFSVTDFTKLVLAMIKDGDRTFFKVNVKDKNSGEVI